MRILFVNRINDRSELALIKGLNELGHEIVCVSDHNDLEVKQLSGEGIHLFQTTFRSRVDYQAINLLRGLFKKFEIDVVYAPAGRSLSSALLTVSSLKTRFISYRGTLGKLSYFNPADLLSFLHPRVETLVANSYAVKDSLIQSGISESKIKVIYKGHNLDWYQKEVESVRREDLGFSDDTFLIGLIANLRPHKGLSVLLDAIKKLPKDFDFKLLLIGSDSNSLAQKLIKGSFLQERVVPLGYQKNPISFAKILNLSVLPSIKNESFSRAIVESMALKIPVIVTDIGGMKELVVNQETGTLIDVGDSKKLALAIQDCMERYSDYLNLAEAGYEHIKEKLSLRNYIQNFESLFREGN